MSKVRHTNLSILPGRSLIVVDDQLLAFLKQLVAMGLTTSWEVRVDEPIKYDFTVTKLMQRLAKKMHVPIDW